METDTVKLPRLIRFTDALRELGLSRSTGERLIQRPDSGFPRPFRIGGVHYYVRDDLRAFIQQKARATKSA